MRTIKQLFELIGIYFTVVSFTLLLSYIGYGKLQYGLTECILNVLLFFVIMNALNKEKN